MYRIRFRRIFPRLAPIEESPVRRTLTLLSAHRKKVAFLVALVTFSAALDIVVPFITKNLIDTLISFFQNKGGQAVSVLVWSAVGILFATAATRLASSIYNYNLFTLVTRVEDEVRNRAVEKYLRLHTLYHHGSSSGQIIGRIDRGGQAIYAILNDIFGQNLLPPLVSFTFIFVVLLYQNAWIALSILIPFPVYLLAIRSITSRIYEIEKKVNDQFETVSKESYDVASNVLTVKKFSQEQAETEHQARLLRRARETQYSVERLWALMDNTQTLISTAGRIAIIVLGGLMVIRGQITIGSFVLYVTLQNMAYAPLWQLSNVLPRLRRNVTRAERVFGLLDEPVHVTDKPGALHLPPLEREIEFRHVWFRYADGRRWAANDVNVIIPAKTTVALVGRSGSGKTTFVNLLLRSFDPQKGAILIDGQDLRDVTQASLRAQIAVVPQEVDLFSRTIAQNIAYGQKNAARADIESAAKTALAHEFIESSEQGYDTMVGERGLKLSGGERQRIGIARAVLRDPRILILDEATSHLDTESERLIQQATSALTKNRTTLIIAHRLSTIVNADIILVFSKGEIEAMGSHAELLQKSPTYQRLYSLQFAENPR